LRLILFGKIQQLVIDFNDGAAGQLVKLYKL